MILPDSGRSTWPLPERHRLRNSRKRVTSSPASASMVSPRMPTTSAPPRTKPRFTSSPTIATSPSAA
eukprot:9173975-Alexandrium_andersonii.AAC.1